MALSIKDLETEQLARDYAIRTGTTITGAVKASLLESMARTTTHETEIEALTARTMAIAKETGDLWPKDFRTFDYDAWLYDENGLLR